MYEAGIWLGAGRCSSEDIHIRCFIWCSYSPMQKPWAATIIISSITFDEFLKGVDKTHI